MPKPVPLTPPAAARLLRGLTQAELAALSGLALPTISNVETGRHRPHTGTRRLFAEALGFTASDVWPPPGKDLAPEIAVVMRNRPTESRRARFSQEQVAELAAEHNWSTIPSDEFGGFSEADYNAAYMRMSPADWRPIVINGDRERPPRWFIKSAIRARAPQAAPRRTPSGGRPRARRTTKSASGSRSAPDADPALARPRRGARA